ALWIRREERWVRVEGVDLTVLADRRPVDQERGAKLEMELRGDILCIAGASQRADNLAAGHVLPDGDPHMAQVNHHRAVPGARGLVALDDDSQAVAIGVPRLPPGGRIDDRAVERCQNGDILRSVDVDAVVEPDQLAVRPGPGVVVRVRRTLAPI